MRRLIVLCTVVQIEALLATVTPALSRGAGQALMAWRALCAATALVLGGVACEGDRPRIDADMTTLPALVELSAPKLARCPHCGWIEAKRQITPLGSPGPLSYEYTVRMRDGSSHVFREDMPVSWRLGERLIYIEGGASLN